MKQRLTSVITARQKSPINFVNARWIVVVLCIILILAMPAAGSANPSHSDLSAQISLYETLEPTWTTTHSVTPSATPTITTTPTATQTVPFTPTPTMTPVPSLSQSGRAQILVSRNNVLYLYTLTGELLGSYEIPYPIDPRPYPEYARDIIPGPNKSIFVYNGTYDPYLSVLDRNSGTWTHITFPEWSTYNSMNYWGIGKLSKYVYLADLVPSLEEGRGILRFNINDKSYERYSLDEYWSNLTIGQDNLLYAHSYATRELFVFDPINMELVHGFKFPTINYIWSIAVNAEGDIFAAASDGIIFHFDNNGQLLNSVESGTSLLDIEISEKGLLVVSGRYGEILLLDEDLVIQHQFQVLGSGYRSYVALLPPQQ